MRVWKVNKMSRFKDAGRTGDVVRASRKEIEDLRKEGCDVKYYSRFGVYRIVENPRKIFYISLG